MSQPRKSAAATSGPAIVVGATMVGAVLVRMWGLGNDPVHHSWVGWIQDEGRWTETARAWVLFGTMETGNFVSSVHLVLAPLWQAITAAFFAVLGVSLSVARLPSALAGSAIVLALALGLRGRLTPWAVATAVLLAACDPALVYFSRVAIPEMLSLLWQMLAFLVLIRSPASVRAAGLAGVLALLALATKATAAPAVLGLGLALVVLGRGGERTAQRLGAFITAVSAPLLLTFLAAPFVVAEPSRIVSQILDFVTMASPFAMLSTLYTSGRGISRGDPSSVNLLLAGAWTVGLCLLPSRSARIVSEPARIFYGAVAWSAGTFCAWVFLDYFPDRWVVHIHLPLIVALASGLSALTSHPPQSDDARSARSDIALRAALALPVALLIAAWIVAAVAPFGLDLDRIRWHFFVLAVTLGLSAFWLRSGSMNRAGLLAAIGLFGLLSWRITAGTQPFETFWTTADRQVAIKTGVAAIAVAIGLLEWRTTDGLPWRRRLLRPLYLFAFSLPPLWLGSAFIGASTPTRVLSDVSEHLLDGYAPGTVIGSHATATVFLGSPFEYRESPWGGAPPEVLVVMMGGGWGEMKSEHTLDGFTITYEVNLPRADGGLAEPASIRVYDRATTPGGRP